MDRASIWIFGLVLFLSGCSKVPSADDHFVSWTVANRIGSEVGWRHGCCQNPEVVTFIETAISNQLTADEAIQIALLNNPGIQATFEELGIAQADLVEAGLLSNPSFEIEIRYPQTRGLRTNIEYLITSSFLDIFLIPLRTKLAATEFEQTKLRVSNEILNLAFDVRETYYELIAEVKAVAYQLSNVELLEIMRDLSTKQYAVGNVNDLETQVAQSKFLEAELELQRAQVEIIQLREKLNRLLGFPEGICLILPNDLPEERDNEEYDLFSLETLAVEERLDLQVARYEIVRLSQMFGVKEWWVYSNLWAGLAGEREPGGANVIGPGFSGELPIFNYGQAARMRLCAQLRQAQDRLSELEIQVRSETREAQKLVTGYQKIVQDYRNHLLPMYKGVLNTSEELFNVMGLGVDKLLENKRQEILANKKYVENVRNFLVAKVTLDRALGGYLYKFLVRQECDTGVDP